MPELAVEAGSLDLFDDDGVGFLQDGDTVGGDFSEDADSETGAGEGLALEDLFGHLQVAADTADLVLEEVAQGLNELELHVFGQAADVVVALDGLRGAFDGGGLDDIRVERALDEPGDLVAFGVMLGLAFCFKILEDGFGFVVEDGDELVADDLALGFGVGNACQAREEALAGVDGDDVEAKLLAHGGLDLFELIFAEDAVVDEDAGQAVADSLVDQDGCNGGVDAAGETADGVAGGADLLADALNGGLDKVLGGPVGLGRADVEHEVFEQLGPLLGVIHLGMELDGPDALFFVGDAGQGAGGLRGLGEAFGQGDGGVAVGHPDVDLGGQAGEEAVVRADADPGVAVFALFGGLDLAAEVMRDELQAVADAEDRQAGGEDLGVSRGSIGVVYGARTAGEDDALRLHG